MRPSDNVQKDYGWKLFSLALAVLTWVTVSVAIHKEDTSETILPSYAPTRDFRVPVLVMSAAADVRACRVNPGYVTVTVRGETKDLDKLQEKDIRAIVDLSDIESARNLRKRIDVSTPPGVTHLGVVPADVEVFVPPKR
jgi:hypothetical protein